LSVLSHVFGAVDKTSPLVFQCTVKQAISSSSSNFDSSITRLQNALQQISSWMWQTSGNKQHRNMCEKQPGVLKS